MKHLILLIALAGSAFAQQFSEYMYESSTTAVTIQRPVTATTTANFHRAWITCAADQTATLKWNGTAATATAGTATKLPNTIFASQAVPYTASDVGSGTTGGTYKVPAGLTYVIDLSIFRMGNTGSSTNLTISTTGTCTITFSWGESL